jgi:cobalt/nickel transport protein
MKRSHYYLLGFLAVAAILVFAIALNPDSDFSGTDDAGSNVNPDYEPWFKNVWEPSGELATLFFTLQAAIGALIIGYFIGSNKVRKERREG